MTDPIPLRRRFPTGLLRDHPPLRSLAEAEVEIAARRAADEAALAEATARARLQHVEKFAPSLHKMKAELLRPRAPIALAPPKPRRRRSLLDRILGRKP